MNSVINLRERIDQLAEFRSEMEIVIQTHSRRVDGIVKTPKLANDEVNHVLYLSRLPHINFDRGSSVLWICCEAFALLRRQYCVLLVKVREYDDFCPGLG
jgi:DNA-binding LacI/PurR family transcriptional regulator